MKKCIAFVAIVLSAYLFSSEKAKKQQVNNFHQLLQIVHSELRNETKKDEKIVPPSTNNISAKNQKIHIKK